MHRRERMAGQQGTDQPLVHPEPSRIERRWGAVLERVASALTTAVAVMLIVFVVVSLIGAVIDTVEPLLHGKNLIQAALQGVDAAFLAIILLELVHTTLSRGTLIVQLQEFLIIGITSGVRSGLEVAAGGRGGEPRQLVVDLAINSAGVLVLVFALWLVRHRFDPGEHPSDDR